MSIRKAFWLLFVGVVSLGIADTGFAQAYPSKVIRVIVPFTPGGINDVMARALQKPLGDALGGTVIVENKAGASTKIAVMDLMKSPPDGHTLMLYGHLAMMGYYYTGIFDFKPWDQLTILGQTGQMAWAMIEARADAPFKTWAELVSYAKKNSGKLSAGGPAPGGMINLIVLETAKNAGFDVAYVPYAGGSQSLVSLLGGHIQYRVAQAGEVYPNVKAGKTRALAVAAPRRLPDFPDVPTLGELGVMFDIPMFGFDFWGPPNMPAALADKISKAVEQALKDPEYVELAKRVVYQPLFAGPEALREDMRKFETDIGPKLEAAFPRQ